MKTIILNFRKNNSNPNIIKNLGQPENMSNLQVLTLFPFSKYIESGHGAIKSVHLRLNNLPKVIKQLIMHNYVNKMWFVTIFVWFVEKAIGRHTLCRHQTSVNGHEKDWLLLDSLCGPLHHLLLCISLQNLPMRYRQIDQLIYLSINAEKVGGMQHDVIHMWGS